MTPSNPRQRLSWAICGGPQGHPAPHCAPAIAVRRSRARRWRPRTARPTTGPRDDAAPSSPSPQALWARPVSPAPVSRMQDTAGRVLSQATATTPTVAHRSKLAWSAFPLFPITAHISIRVSISNGAPRFGGVGSQREAARLIAQRVHGPKSLAAPGMTSSTSRAAVLQFILG